MIILGINAYHGDSAACIVRNGCLVAAAEEERFRRVKHWAGLPSRAVEYCLDAAGVQLNDIDHIAVSRNPRTRLPQKLIHVLARRPSLSTIRDRLMNQAKVNNPRDALARELGVPIKNLKANFHNVGHHLSHCGSAFLVSPFEKAAVVSIDGFGDFASTMVAAGEGTRIKPIRVIGFPHSLGVLYTAITQYLGFNRYGDEYKIMGLASYGQPEYLEELRRMVRTLDDGSFKLGLEYFRHHTDGIEMSWNNSEPSLGTLYSNFLIQRLGPPRPLGEAPSTKEENLAASLQIRTEEVYFHLMKHAHKQTQSPNLCLSGGVAFNSVANGKLFEQTPFQEVFIQVAAGDAGTAIGAAFHVHNTILNNPRKFVMNSPYWGPEYDDNAIRAELDNRDLEYQVIEDEELYARTAEAIAAGKIVGWFQGRMEWGPRALGNRSILADPRRPEMKDILNARIKRREPFRPFAPSILEEAVTEYFEESYPDPFMIKVYPVKVEKHDVIPAVTHVDGTGRLQTVSREINPRYWALIKRFEQITGVPVVLNTSFNENEPIVCTPGEALDCFLRTRMDFLAIGNNILEKEIDPCSRGSQ